MRRILFAAALSVLAACDVEYDFKGGTPEPQVVVNAIISPQQDFSFGLCWSGVYNAENPEFEPVCEASVRLFEDGREVLAFKTAAKSDGDDILAASGPENTFPFRGRAGSRYRLEIDVPDYGRVAAETEIPDAPSVELHRLRDVGAYRHFEMSKLVTGRHTSAIWIRGFRVYEGYYNGHTERHGEYYTSSPFVDTVNGVNDAYDAEDKGSVIDFERFLRISPENFADVVPLRFSAYGSNLYGYNESLYHTICVYAASDSYDRYYRSLYKYETNTGWNAEENPFVEQISVYSNIENGLGIFAGCNCVEFVEL